MRVLPTPGALVSTAAALARQHQLLTNDALIAAFMGQYGLSLLASGDSDLDRVPGIARYAPA